MKQFPEQFSIEWKQLILTSSQINETIKTDIVLLPPVKGYSIEIETPKGCHRIQYRYVKNETDETRND